MALKAVGDGLFAESYGSWPPTVIALHGWGRRGTDFDRVLDGLDAAAVDLPGFGASPPPQTVMGAEGYADRLVPFVSDLSEPPVIVGHSFGGRVAVCLAGRVPVAGLVLTGVPLTRARPVRPPSLGYRLMRLANRIGVLSDVRMERERRRRGSADYRAATGVMRDVLVTVVNETYEAQLAALSVPVSLVWGAEDGDVPVAVAEWAADLLERSGVPVTLEVLAGVGHHTPLEAPDALRRAVDEMVGP